MAPLATALPTELLVSCICFSSEGTIGLRLLMIQVNIAARAITHTTDMANNLRFTPKAPRPSATITALDDGAGLSTGVALDAGDGDWATSRPDSCAMATARTDGRNSPGFCIPLQPHNSERMSEAC